MADSFSAESPPALQAATVVIARPGDDGPEIYMLRRSAKSPFMPSTLVFPGGRLDPEDGTPDADATWERAARRECLEEAGVDLGGRPLTWFDTWLTPSAESRRRYLARFFLARLDRGEGDEARADGHETHEGRWSSIGTHLRAWDAGDVDLPPPTLCTLLQLERLGRTDAQLRQHFADEAPRDVILPKVLLRDGQVFIVMPHDPEYDAIAGDARPAPSRVHDHPMRFVRDERVWRPCSTR